MTREELLRSMKGPELIKEADKLGVKVKCNKDRNKLVEAKAALVDRILAFEAEQAEIKEKTHEPKTKMFSINPITGKEYYHGFNGETTNLIETSAPENVVVNVIEDIVPTPKRGALIEYNGKSQNICKWAKELGISANTLYGRLYKLGWTVEKAFTKGGRKR